MKKIKQIGAAAVVLCTFGIAALAAVKAGQSLWEQQERELLAREEEFEKVYVRNQEAQSRVQEMRQEIQELHENKEELSGLLEQISSTQAELVLSEELLSGEDFRTLTVSENRFVSGNTADIWSMAVSGNESVSGNTADIGSMAVSGNESVSGNTADIGSMAVSGNESVSGNTTGFGSMAVSGNVFVYGNQMMQENLQVSENLPSFVIEVGEAELTLEERRQYRTSMQETIETNQADRVCLEESSIDFSEKKIVCLGDSLTAASNLDTMEEYEKYSYPACLERLLGAKEVVNLGIGGSSIGRYWADAFVDRYQEIPEDADIILVMGGTNDGFCASAEEFGSLSKREYRTFCGDLDELMRGLQERYPEADVFFATPLPNILHDYLRNERDYLLPQKYFADAVRALSQEYGYGLIDLYNSNLLDSHDAEVVEKYMTDGVHCTLEGYQILAEHVGAEMVRYYESRLQSIQ